MKLQLTVFLICCFLFQGNAFSISSYKNKTGDKRPNIIFILTDDQRWSALGYAGNDIIQTPEMDKLAEAGTYFRNAIVTTPICSASRSSIFTGVHERTHKYTFQTGTIRDEFMQSAYPRLLKDAGYYTGFYGKFGVNYPAKGEMFDVIEDYDRNGSFGDYRGYYYKTLDGDTVHLTRYTGQKALDFIENAPEGKPFCLSLSFSAPHAHDNAHDQYFWQEEPGELYQDIEIPKADISDDKYFNALPLPVREGFNRTRWYWRYDTPEKYQHSIKGYYRMIYGIDLEIAKIRKKLKETGQDKNTVIILMGDNGQFLGERQLAGKWLMYDNSIRVPLIVFDPRTKNHSDVDQMALNIDVPSTILDLAGLEIPASYQGKSLAGVVDGTKNSLDRDTVLIEHLWNFENIPPSEGVRTSEWKYLRYVNDKSSEELYNLKDDPKEINNLAGKAEYQNILRELSRKNYELAKKYADPYVGVPSCLSVENIRDPRFTKIIDSRPEFNWVVPQGAVTQKAYQVLVASTKEMVSNNIGDVWDSGMVNSNQSTNVEFGGGQLKPNTSYFWKVRVQDKDKRLTEYSCAQQFHTGDFGESVSSENKFQVEYINPVVFKKVSVDSYFIDFGKDAFGTLVLDYKASKKEILTIRLGEKLKDGKIDRKPGGHIRYNEVELAVEPGKIKYVLQLPPDKRNTGPRAVHLPDSIGVVMPFRYAEIENASKNISDKAVSQKACFYYFEYGNSSFNCSDSILNQVWDICKYSMKATSFAGLYVDGDRERIPYEADAYINQLSHYSVDDEYTIARRTIEYFMKCPTWPTEWQLHVPLLFYQDYMYTGNTELIEKYYGPLKYKTLMELEDSDGFISTHSPKLNGEVMANLGFADTTQRVRDIVDWPQAGGFGSKGEDDGFVFLPINTVINSMYYKNMEIMAEFAQILGKTEEALDFKQRAAKVKKSINQKLYNKEKGYYTDGIGTDHGSVHANMFPLAFGVVPPEYKKSVVEHIKTRGMACSVYGAQYLMEAVYNAGAGDYALDLMTATHDRSWYNMIKIGSTITLEAWAMKYKPNSDWNHAWGAAPGNIIPRYMWGVQPLSPGFGVAEIKPQMGWLKNCSIEVPTIKGIIKAEFVSSGSRTQKYTIELPANMVAEFKMDFSQQGEATLNGNSVNLSFGSIRLNSGVNEIVIKKK